jgi:hypothetical protein
MGQEAQNKGSNRKSACCFLMASSGVNTFVLGPEDDERDGDELLPPDDGAGEE